MGSSVAGRNLPTVSQLAKNPAIKVVGKVAGPLAFGVEFAGNYMEGDSLSRNASKTGGGAVGGAIGGFAGGALCGAAAFASLGLGAAGCPVAIGVLGAAGSWAGNKIGGLVADALDW